uniref:Thymidylate synthase n=1 Tax=Meloidogyne floridensis TaxID=298350 RepID=A0A915NZM5_9BILA
MELINQSKIECNQHNEENLKNNLNIEKEEENVNIDEMKYLNQIKEIMNNGVLKSDRTGTGTISIFGMQARYNLRNGMGNGNNYPQIGSEQLF